MRFIATVLILLGMLNCRASSILEGSVTDEVGRPIPRALILRSDSESIIYTDEQGKFSINALPGLRHIRVLAPGFVPQRITAPYLQGEKLDIRLSSIYKEGTYKAHEIVRRAQIRRPMNEDRYTAFTAKAYQKTTAHLEEVPFDLWQVSGTLIPAKADTGLVYWSERTSLLAYHHRNNFNDSTLAFHAAGHLALPAFYNLNDLILNFYKSHVRIKERRYREYFSPLYHRSLRLYEFSPAGIFYDEGRKVYRIAFKPKKAGMAAFSGVMELYDSTYTLRSMKLRATAEQHLELVDSIKVEQFYFYHRGTYRKAYQNLHYHLNLIGFVANYEVNTFYEDFTYGPEEKDFEHLIYRFDSIAVSDDNDYWEQVRREKPEGEELELQQEHNLNALFKEDYSSLSYLHNKFYPLKLFYRRYERRGNNYYLNFAPIYYALGYNTVEGRYFRYSLPVRIFEEEHEWLLRPEIRYGFSDRTWKSTFHAAYIYDLLQPKKLILEGGRTVKQFNEHQPILPLVNTFYSLFMAQNYLKLFGKDYVMAGFDHEIVNGLEVNSRFEYAKRYPLFNTTDFHLLGNDDNFTPNNEPLPTPVDSNGFETHNALTLELDFVYQFGQQHQIINGRKINVETRKPAIRVNFRSGLPTPISQTSYAFLSTGISFLTRFGNQGYSQWDLSGGGFLYGDNIPFIDYKHFNGEQTFFLQPAADDLNNIRKFSTLQYYRYSTRRPYIEAHFQHNFDGFLLSKIPFTRRRKIHSFTGFNYLHSYDDSQFLEFFIGFNNILSALRVEFAGTLSNFTEFRPLIRIGVDFDYLYYYQHTY